MALIITMRFNNINVKWNLLWSIFHQNYISRNEGESRLGFTKHHSLKIPKCQNQYWPLKFSKAHWGWCVLQSRKPTRERFEAFQLWKIDWILELFKFVEKIFIEYRGLEDSWRRKDAFIESIVYWYKTERSLLFDYKINSFTLRLHKTRITNCLNDAWYRTGIFSLKPRKYTAAPCWFFR